MLNYLMTGVTYAFAAAVQPGPFQAYLVSSVLTFGWRRTLPAVFAPILSDVPIICLVLFVLTRVPPLFANALRIAGGLFLLYLAAGAFEAFRHYAPALPSRTGSARRTFLEAATVNVLNPNPYLGWSLVMGPAVLGAWRVSPSYGVALVVAFYLTMFVFTGVMLLAFAGARTLGPRLGRALVGLSAVALAAFGMYQLWNGAVSIAIRS